MSFLSICSCYCEDEEEEEEEEEDVVGNIMINEDYNELRGALSDLIYTIDYSEYDANYKRKMEKLADEKRILTNGSNTDLQKRNLDLLESSIRPVKKKDKVYCILGKHWKSSVCFDFSWDNTNICQSCKRDLKFRRK